MLASGGEPLQLTSDSVDKHVEVFSPDGIQIYYANDFTGEESFSVPTLGGASAVVAHGYGLAVSPHQLPNARKAIPTCSVSREIRLYPLPGGSL